MSQQSYTATLAGGLPVEITSHLGTVDVRVDAGATHAVVRVHTTDTEGPCADAVRDTVIDERSGTLRVKVPQLPGGGSHLTFSGGNVVGNISFAGGGMVVSSGDVVIGGRKVVENGRVVAQQGTVVGGAGAGTVTVEVVLPTASSLAVETTNAELTVRGEVDELAFDSRNGSLQADAARRLDATTHNGSLLVDRIEEELEAAAHNGSVTIGAYNGRRGAARTHNGDITISATPASSGQLSARTHNGNIRLRGADHLTTRTKTHNGRVW
ncbi:DUF4097 family beta strand repeat-containing protein [Streptomyces sp. NPDC006992]|uniref:DUF4097 family beta strand repeat-containing protein n=1 Tax=Streptomyces sp. NPDC006992 TaxID=3155601 RepID=UPI0033FFF73F